MPSLISHAIVGAAAGAVISTRYGQHLILLSIIASAIPDIDGIAFALGIPYKSMFGHRGFFHSIFFAFVFSIAIVHIGFPYIKIFSGRWFFWQLIFFCITLSHGILDAMTAGGMGVAFFSPFSSRRYLLPWKLMIACPLRIEDFFSEWGKIVLKSEFFWIWLPSFIVMFFSFWLK